MSRSIWAARHGSRFDFADPAWARTAKRPHDPPLTDLGRRQAFRLGTRLRSEAIRQVFSSPFLRCVETAAMVVEALDLDIKIEEGISEWLNPDWFPERPDTAGRDELRSRFERIDESYRSRGAARFGESGEEALARAARTALVLMEEFEGDLLFVGHGASVRGVAEGLLALPPGHRSFSISEMPFCCLVQLTRRDGRWRMELPCDTSHLERVEGGRRFH